MQFSDVLKTRVSTRSFLKDPVPEEDIRRILDAALYAPVGMHRFETLHLSVVRDKDILERIRLCAVKASGDANADPLHGAPVLIVVSSSDTGTVGALNVSCLVENMLLAATDLGLGNLYVRGVIADTALPAAARSLAQKVWHGGDTDDPARRRYTSGDLVRQIAGMKAQSARCGMRRKHAAAAFPGSVQSLRHRRIRQVGNIERDTARRHFGYCRPSFRFQRRFRAAAAGKRILSVPRQRRVYGTNGEHLAEIGSAEILYRGKSAERRVLHDIVAQRISCGQPCRPDRENGFRQTVGGIFRKQSFPIPRRSRRRKIVMQIEYHNVYYDSSLRSVFIQP